MRERLSSRLGFILLSAGCAIGLGNVWRFPYITGQNGGGWFVALYLVFLALVGLPILLMEFATGRAAQRSITILHATLTPEKPLWRIHGVAGLIGSVMLMMFYTTVTGWMLIYFVKSVSGAFAGLDVAGTGAAFGTMLGDWKLQTMAMLVVTIFAAGICALRLSTGLERVTKYMMAGLLLLIVILAVHSLTLDGAEKGVSFYLVPNLARMREVGILKVIFEAMSHAFFTLSLGIGAMAIFGSYISKRHTLLTEGLHVAALDTFVAITSGLIIMPACFAFGITPGQGPGLIFVTLPNVFMHMTGGCVWGSLFFLFMSVAALTTVLAVFECVIACVRDVTSWGRAKTATLVGITMAFLAMPCILGFSVWKGFTPFGPGSGVLDLEDFVVSTLLLPLGGLSFALYCCHRYGWGWEKFRDEVNAGDGLHLPTGLLRIYCAYILPLIIAVVFLLGVVDKLKG